MEHIVKASLPHRLDIGGTWDLPPLLYFGRQYQPKTLTIALDILTKVTLVGSTMNQQNAITVNQYGQQPLDWVGRLKEHDYTSNLGLIQAIIAFFGIKNTIVVIDIGVPPQIGLGGSGVLSAALTKACIKYTGSEETLPETVRIAHEIENGFFSMTGFQDQMAALAGGVRLWRWGYPPENSVGETLLTPREYSELENRIVIALVGKHDSTEINQQQVRSFLAPANRQDWRNMNRGTALAANAIQNHDWDQLTACIRHEHDFRNKIAPQRIAGMEAYIAVTEGRNGAFATAGAGQAVCWYFNSNAEDVLDVRNKWKSLGACILPSTINPVGVRQPKKE